MKPSTSPFKRVVSELVFVECLEHLADNPVELVRVVAVAPSLTRAVKALGRCEGVVDIGGGQMEKEGLLRFRGLFPDPLH